MGHMSNDIMIVDDDPDVCESLKMALESQQYQVITVNSGAECLKKLEQGFKGIILLDLMMPKLDGWDTIKEIKNQGFIKNVAIEIISALGVRENQRMGLLEPYVYDYINKPIDIRELISSVKKCNAYLLAKNTEEEI